MCINYLLLTMQINYDLLIPKIKHNLKKSIAQIKRNIGI